MGKLLGALGGWWDDRWPVVALALGLLAFVAVICWIGMSRDARRAECVGRCRPSAPVERVEYDGQAFCVCAQGKGLTALPVDEGGQ